MMKMKDRQTIKEQEHESRRQEEKRTAEDGNTRHVIVRGETEVNTENRERTTKREVLIKEKRGDPEFKRETTKDTGTDDMSYYAVTNEARWKWQEAREKAEEERNKNRHKTGVNRFHNKDGNRRVIEAKHQERIHHEVKKQSQF